MSFIQVIEFRTTKIEEFRKLEDEFGDRIAAEMTARRSILCEARDEPGRCFQIVFFDSYESAMKNSDLPLTREFADRMRSIAEGDASFYNLDVVDDRTM